MLGGADNPNGELPSYITGADSFGIQGAQIAVKLGFKGIQGRLANLLLFIDHYFNAHKSHLS